MEGIVQVFSALWLGILASISPCPFASNLAAFSFIEKDCTNHREVLKAGLSYTLGRIATFTFLGFLISQGTSHISIISMALQKHGNMFLGPILVIVGVFVLDLLEIPPLKITSRMKAYKFYVGGPKSAFLMGILFALALCPVSAALFFGGLVPLAVRAKSYLLLPATFGLGSALPVSIMALSLSIGISAFIKSEQQLQRIQTWAKTVTGSAMIIIGLYFCFAYNLKIIT
ncbi:aromatic aminobenezylarsenical efflux permease ArsG family transporter [Thermovirga lienii]|uniref:aromatic aminobenezylarsenical efflux permease ArsG family transporter n=1 Tax=Thermovirga lienii TaxID=336261 RepID=UPI000EC4C388|nr:cytochrome C biogenesis protein [Thermovirga lienii]